MNKKAYSCRNRMPNILLSLSRALLSRLKILSETYILMQYEWSLKTQSMYPAREYKWFFFVFQLYGSIENLSHSLNLISVIRL